MKSAALPAILLSLPLSVMTAHAAKAETEKISLVGEWRLQMMAAEWDAAAKSQPVHLPGSLQHQGFGNEVTPTTPWIGLVKNRSVEKDPLGKPGAVKIPFWLQPAKHFIGNACYHREFVVPADWQGRELHLLLERVHVTSKIWLDGKLIGSENSLSTPHTFQLGSLAPGRHSLSILINNQSIPNIGDNSHCVSDHMQTSWNGIIGRICITATPATWLDGIETTPDLTGKRVLVKWRLGGKPAEGKIRFKVTAPDGKIFTADSSSKDKLCAIPLGEKVHPWDEFAPQLYHIEATLLLANGARHKIASPFGLVDYKVSGRHFLVNGRRTLFRGTLDCACYPMTGYPSTDVAYWKREFAVCKAHGLNHIRFHSWCPPEAAFIAADELGCYLQIEHAWTKPSSAGPYLMREAERVIRSYGNHPSFAMHCYGNEPFCKPNDRWLARFSAHFRKRDPRRFYSGAAGRDAFPHSQFSIPQDQSIRLYPWKAGLRSPINAHAPQSVSDFGAKTRKVGIPVISHEPGQWCVYPNFDEIKKYTGFLKAKNFEIFRDRLRANHMIDQARDFLMASGRLQLLCYKHEIEMLLRTPDIGGYQLLGLNDFPGQGSALVGAVDPFWDTKPYTSPEEYTSFSGPSVPLASLPKFVFKADETLTATLKFSHYAATPLRGALPEWALVDAAGKQVRSGKLPPRDIPIGQCDLGKINLPLQGLAAPAQYKLLVSIADTSIRNRWDIWVYPAQTPPANQGQVIVTRNTEEAKRQAEQGKSVLLIPDAKAIVEPAGPKVVFGFSTIFWNTEWSERQAPTTMGILCKPEHPLFASFPTEYHSNYQWWYLIKKTSKPLSLAGQEPSLRPLLQVIDDWFTANRLGLVLEAKYGKGKLLVCAIDLENLKPDEIVAAQFRASLLTYMNSDHFAPKHALNAATLGKIVR